MAMIWETFGRLTGKIPKTVPNKEGDENTGSIRFVLLAQTCQ